MGWKAKKIAFSYQPTASKQKITEAFQGEFNVLIIRSKIEVDTQFLEQTTSLKYIGRGGAGLDNLDLKACKLKGIECFNAGEANSQAVAEHTLGMLLSLIRNISSSYQELKNSIWLREENRGVELSNLIIGVIGFGNTGSAFARTISGLGSKVLAYDKYKSGFGSKGILETSLKELVAAADVISLHIPLTSETNKWVDSKFINECKDAFILLNMSRGGIVCLSSVMDGLHKCKIGGFGADVWENENFQTFTPEQVSTFELATSKNNVILTPHIAGWTVESYKKISEVLLRKIIKCV